MDSTNLQKTFYDFTAIDIDGNEIELSRFKGKKVLVVNVASKCGLTHQYEELQTLYETYGPDKFVIIGFPSNNFLFQEPGSNERIKEFCSSKYHITFPLMSKISVKGRKKHELYKWLTESARNGVANAKVTWNFQKYLIDEEGNWLTYFAPKVKPMSQEVVSWLN
jgi:glutathione peroxidase